MRPRIPPVTLSDLFSRIGRSVGAAGGVSVSGLSYNSKTVSPGDLFVAMKGLQSDGHAFIGDAVEKGAVAALIESDVTAAIPVIRVPSSSALLSPLAAALYGRPSETLRVIGITGTNGKTTVTFLLEDLIAKNGRACGVLGTVNYRFGNERWPAPNTTPLASDIQGFARYLADRKAAALVMEVSSHALALGRVADVRFYCGVFMNLTQDHLDYHGTMEDYFQAKSRLFADLPDNRCVLNIDDTFGRRLAATRPGAITFGTAADASIRATRIACDLSGVRFNLSFKGGGTHAVASNLIGRHNVSNLLAAAGAALAFGFSEVEIVTGLSGDHAVPGRLERVDCGQEFVVAVDYAHTPDALAKVLEALRDLRPNRLVCVFGAGGDRDKTKRPLMGEIAARLADHAVVTSDNPRTEDPVRILADVEEGVRRVPGASYVTIENRRDAIRAAIAGAGPGDIVLIAGKGHEDYQIYGAKKFHFSDREEARKVLTCG